LEVAQSSVAEALATVPGGKDMSFLHGANRLRLIFGSDFIT
jgi:hypothetical protein